MPSLLVDLKIATIPSVNVSPYLFGWKCSRHTTSLTESSTTKRKRERRELPFVTTLLSKYSE
jgi:hypothetical protein